MILILLLHKDRIYLVSLLCNNPLLENTACMCAKSLQSCSTLCDPIHSIRHFKGSQCLLSQTVLRRWFLHGSLGPQRQQSLHVVYLGVELGIYLSHADFK